MHWYNSKDDDEVSVEVEQLIDGSIVRHLDAWKSFAYLGVQRRYTQSGDTVKEAPRHFTSKDLVLMVVFHQTTATNYAKHSIGFYFFCSLNRRAQ